MSGETLPAIGTLTDRVQLLRRSVVDEAEGGQVTSFAPLAYTWARVRQLSARQSFETDARGADISHSVVMRFRNDLKPGDRIVHRGRVLSIESVADMNGRRAFLSCPCSERVVTA